jgi:ribonuclease PH
MTRHDNRLANQARELKITTNFTLHAEGSVLIETGNTKVICTASIEEGVPPFLRGKKSGWLSAEYSMLPRSTFTRTKRERSKVGGRTQEIQRLIGRSLRSIVDLNLLGEQTIWIDCDVIQADGGTRTASISGGYVALVLALQDLQNRTHCFRDFPIKQQLAAISLGVLGNEILLDLDYLEDRNADVDLNVIMTDTKNIVEVQGTAEKVHFTRQQLNEMLDMAEYGLANHFARQLHALGGTIAPAS